MCDERETREREREKKIEKKKVTSQKQQPRDLISSPYISTGSYVWRPLKTNVSSPHLIKSANVNKRKMMSIKTCQLFSKILRRNRFHMLENDKQKQPSCKILSLNGHIIFLFPSASSKQALGTFLLSSWITFPPSCFPPIVATLE